MIYFILWICCGIVSSQISFKKGNSDLWGCFIGFLLGPIGILIVYFDSDNQKVIRKRKGNTLMCPNCREYIKPLSTICRYCHQPITETDRKNYEYQRYSEENFTNIPYTLKPKEFISEVIIKTVLVILVIFLIGVFIQYFL